MTSNLWLWTRSKQLTEEASSVSVSKHINVFFTGLGTVNSSQSQTVNAKFCLLWGLRTQTTGSCHCAPALSTLKILVFFLIWNMNPVVSNYKGYSLNYSSSNLMLFWDSVGDPAHIADTQVQLVWNGTSRELSKNTGSGTEVDYDITLKRRSAIFK